MLFRIAAITLIFVLTSVAWVILGATIDYRTHDSDTRLTPGVGSTWGTPHEQRPPTACYGSITLPIQSSRIRVNLALDYRQKGLLWFSTYTVDFDGRYDFQNTASQSQP